MLLSYVKCTHQSLHVTKALINTCFWLGSHALQYYPCFIKMHQSMQRPWVFQVILLIVYGSMCTDIYSEIYTIVTFIYMYYSFISNHYLYYTFFQPTLHAVLRAMAKEYFKQWVSPLHVPAKPVELSSKKSGFFLCSCRSSRSKIFQFQGIPYCWNML